VWVLGKFGTSGHDLSFPKPLEVTGLPPCTAVSTYGEYSLALGEDGSVWAWGIETECDRGRKGHHTIACGPLSHDW
jgi:hypothetical protein